MRELLPQDHQIPKLRYIGRQAAASPGEFSHAENLQAFARLWPADQESVNATKMKKPLPLSPSPSI